MAQLQCRLRELMAEKSRREHRRITYREIRRVTGIALNTLSGLNQLPLPRLIGTSVIERLCAYFRCEVGDLFVVAPEPSVVVPEPPTQENTKHK